MTDAIGLYAGMRRIRRFEEAAYRAYERGDVPGTIHASIGQEAVAVGVMEALRPTDLVLSHHRGHGHALAKGVPSHRLMAELFGRSDGVSRGKGGSMHVTDTSCGFLGSFAVVGGSIPLAVGAALAQRTLGTGAAAVVFFGDGALGQGVLYESFNLAAILDLPTLFVCENNGYAISVQAGYALAGRGGVERARAFGLVAQSVDGQDVLAVRAGATTLLDEVRQGRPALLECRTYRFMGHSRGDPSHGIYRTEDEVAGWRDRDPLDVLVATAALDAAAVAAVDTQVDAEIEAAIAFAHSSAHPTDAEALEDILDPSVERLWVS